MRGKLLAKCSCVVLAFAGLVSVASADVRLPSLFSDHMMLQRDMAVPVWGWADVGEEVAVSVGEQSKTTTADAGGKWSVRLDPLAAGGPLVLKVQGKNVVQVSDVLVGEVWLCSGQSNMAMNVAGVRNKDSEIAAASHPKIRMLIVARKTAEEPQSDCQCQWKPCSPATVAEFSATAYFFGRELHGHLDVPVGLINSSVGGTPIQSWTSVAAHAAEPKLAAQLVNLKRAIETWDPEAAKKRYEKQLADWTRAAAEAKQAHKPFTTRKPRMQEDPRVSVGSPGRLYNGMIAPLAPFAIRGAIWYQGEANAGVPGAAIYGLQLTTMITSWRKVWNQGDFPFLFVQLPNFKAAQQKPSETDGWPLIREQFVKTLRVPNTGMAITIDVGEADDIHPKNKQEVGKRLAQWALAKTYGRDVVASGPLYRSMRKQGDKIVLEFDYADGLTAKDGKLKGFAIAGADKKFVWAEARVEGRSVVVSSPDVPSPEAVRYAWANNPECNLYNGAGLPASPLRTDDWAE